MWRDGSLYVAAPPHIWKFTDTNDDGVADKREVWFDGKTLTGCANDLHGPYRGPDGWIYWCKGAFAKQTYTLPSGRTFTTRAAHIFRARPDGSGIEPVMTGGMDNPVDTVFTPGGERIFSTTFLQRPAAGLRDGLIHAIYGGIYGKDHDPVYEPHHKWTSPEFMPVLVHQGPSAPCGLHRYESDQFGPDYRDNVFSCQFNLRKVSRHVLKPSGRDVHDRRLRLCRLRQHRFSSDRCDRRRRRQPADHQHRRLVQALLPQLAAREGRRAGRHLSRPEDRLAQVSDPRGTDGRLEDFVARESGLLLGDSRPSWRRRAIEELGAARDAALTAIGADSGQSEIAVRPRDRRRLGGVPNRRRRSPPARVRRRSTTTTKRSARPRFTPSASGAIKEAVPALVDSCSNRPRDTIAAPPPKPSAESAIRPPPPRSSTALADAANDRALDHSLTYALIEIGENERSAKAARLETIRKSAGRRLIALDQIGAPARSRSDHRPASMMPTTHRSRFRPLDRRPASRMGCRTCPPICGQGSQHASDRERANATGRASCQAR